MEYRENLYKIRKFFLYGSGWPIDMSQSSMQTHLEISGSDDEKNFHPVYHPWKDLVEETSFGGMISPVCLMSPPIRP